MKIILPTLFDPAKITTNIAIDEVVWSAGTHTKGQRRYVMPSRDLYEVVVDSTDDDPISGAAREPTPDDLLNVKTWALVGKVNAYACFDNKLAHPTIFTDGFDMTIAPDGTVRNGMAIFNVSSASVLLTMTDPIEGVVYSRNISTIDFSNVDDLYDWHFAPIIQKPDIILTDLPSFSEASIRIEIDGAGSLGEVVLGYVKQYGTSLFGTQISTYSFSRKEFDVFGDAIIKKRNTAKRADFVANIDSEIVDYVQYELSQRDAIPTVFVGSDDFASTVIFGFHLDFTVTLAGPSVSKCNIRIEGLI